MGGVSHMLSHACSRLQTAADVCSRCSRLQPNMPNAKYENQICQIHLSPRLPNEINICKFIT